MACTIQGRPTYLPAQRQSHRCQWEHPRLQIDSHHQRQSHLPGSPPHPLFHCLLHPAGGVIWSSRWQILGAASCLSDQPMQSKFKLAPTHLDVKLCSGCPETVIDNTNSVCMQANCDMLTASVQPLQCQTRCSPHMQPRKSKEVVHALEMAVQQTHHLSHVHQHGQAWWSIL